MTPNWEGLAARVQSTAVRTFSRTGQLWTFTPQAGTPVSGLQGIFRDGTVEAALETGATVRSREFEVHFQVSALGQDPKEDDVFLDEQSGLSYTVKEPPEFDGEGMVRVVLNRPQQAT